ncbi:hypothetical protein EK21DRAFT_88755 [Setomelanomma holmii]|uniref:Uncharacterized protein n=1 Tax=Setomelanomma holmii TaxID=210430 RepID=A0A9P4HAH4_9PLEO|nr:hypothetical protein EK21DRAFT_88755 [Setomelanomma holmii]
MPIFTRAIPSQPSTPPSELFKNPWAPSAPAKEAGISSSSPSSSDWDLLDYPSPPSTDPTSRLPTPVPSLSSWDTALFSEKSSQVLPNSRNGDWRTSALHNIANPFDTAASLNASGSWSNVYDTLSNSLEAASDNLQDSLDRVFQGKDIPAMHDRVVKLLPSISMPSLRHVCQSIDTFTDTAMTLTRFNQSETRFLDQELLGDRFAFARHVGANARRGLVKQGICRDWQIMPSRANMHWQARFASALVRLFEEEKAAFSVEQLFGMTPVWVGDVESKTWRLQLKTGLTEIVVEEEGDEFEEKEVYLDSGFGLPESCGCVKVRDIERDGVEDGYWMAIDT